MKNIEITDVTFETNLIEFTYKSETIPNINDIICVNNITYIIIDKILHVNSEKAATLLVEPVYIQYGDYIN